MTAGTPIRWIRAASAVTAAVTAALASAAPVSAHPLGNFTINHYSGIRVSADNVLVDHVTDFAEIPTFQERRGIDSDGDRAISDAEAAGYRRSACTDLAVQLELVQDGRRLALDVVETGLSFPEGQGAPTTRLVCVYRADLGTALAGSGTFTFEDRSFAERLGWREIVVEADGTSLTSTDALAESVSARLTEYPSGLLDVPADQSRASWTVVPGGPTLPPFDVSDAAPVVEDSQPVPPAAEPGGAEPPSATSTTRVPDSVSELGGELGALFQTRDLTLPLVLLSLLLAAGIGAVHALSPGHGKTVMAAYLVGTRGSMRHAVGLGLTVTVSHTLGVLALGVLSLSAASFLPPERLYPILGVVSGGIVILIGLYLIGGRVRDALRSRAVARLRAAAHDQDHGHGHPHAQPTDHEHTGGGHDRDAGHADSGRIDAGDEDGWHSHGGLRHTHLPPEGRSVSWRGLFALGLAGGMVPSVSALILLLGSISLGRPAYGILLTVAFGLGMAVVLVGIGVALVYARGFLERLPVRSSGARLARLLPAATAVIVLGAGILITTQALLTING